MTQQLYQVSTHRNGRSVRLGVMLALIGAVVATAANGLIGWASNAYDWHPPTFIFTNGLMVLSWVTVVAVIHHEAGGRRVEAFRDELRAELRADVHAEVTALKQSVRDLLRAQPARGSARVAQADRYLQLIDRSES
ncbi:hypothetical protein [Amycolatopsis echigonensis]|uniref:Uncharacterized protein n=1 Tax=Amycolatopsis echigonensis TaxID=2576905 RepID=A0A8E1W9E4_9PSEU|nr:hypothetical protein [Amycolatopsis echigonensis]MBB2505993.1 hypothetical protein [Amycolatopsis echigonensis]